jgi:hypothetical protein
MTGALKYGLRLGFLIPDELDPENDKEEVRNTRTTGQWSKPINTVAQVEKAVNKVPATAFPYGANDPLPPQMYENGASKTLTEDARATAIEMENFVPLTDARNEQIQNRLKALVTDKVVDRRKLSLFLDKQHEGKKAFDVPATQWETTMSKIEGAVTAGPDAVKMLLKGE